MMFLIGLVAGFVAGVVVGLRAADAVREARRLRLQRKGPALRSVHRIGQSLHFEFEGVAYVSDLSWLGPSNELTSCSHTYRADGGDVIDISAYVRFQAAYQVDQLRERDTKLMLREIGE